MALFFLNKKMGPTSSYYIRRYEHEKKNSVKYHDRLLDFNLALATYIVSKIDLDCELKIKDIDPAVEAKKLVDPKSDMKFQTTEYRQTYSDKYPFQNNLSIIDLLFNEGPNSITIIADSSGS